MAITFAPPKETEPFEAFTRTMSGLAHDVVDVLRELARRPRHDDDLAFEVVTRIDRLEELGPAWDKLVFDAQRYRPQASFAYVASYLEHLRPAEVPWACVVATRRGELVGALPFLIRPAPQRGLAGVELDAASIEADVVFAPSDEAALRELVDALAQAAPRWVTLRFGELQATSPTVERLRHDPGAVVLDPVGHASYLDLPATNDEYLARLVPSFRKNVARQARKLLNLEGSAIEFVEAGAATPAHLDAFMTTEATGWKGREGNAIARRTELAAYYAAVTTRLARAGALEWTLVRAEGKVLAAGLGVRMGRKLALDKIAYDESYSAVGPGNVMLAHIIEHAIARGLTELDFLTDHEWNRRWHAERRDTFDVVVYRRSARALVPWYLPDVARRTLRGPRS